MHGLWALVGIGALEPGFHSRVLAHNDPTFRAAADSAMRAVSNPRCQPWPLSPDKYNSWRTITFNFDPRDY